MSEATVTAPNFLYAGMNGPYSVIPLLRLLQQGLRPQAILLPHADSQSTFSPSNSLPVSPPEPSWQLLSVAEKEGIETYYCPDSASIEPILGRFSPDFVVVVGWPGRIPAAVLNIPKNGWLNLHPSLLPTYRGPAPLFWQLRDGAQLGVSLHRMDADFDTGPLLAQAVCSQLDGENLQELETQLAEKGAELLSAAMRQPAPGWNFQQQDESVVMAQGWPKPADYYIDNSHSARAAYNFLSAMLQAGRTCGLELATGKVTVQAVLSWKPARLVVESEQGVIEIDMGAE